MFCSMFVLEMSKLHFSSLDVKRKSALVFYDSCIYLPAIVLCLQNQSTYILPINAHKNELYPPSFHNHKVYLLFSNDVYWNRILLYNKFHLHYIHVVLLLFIDLLYIPICSNSQVCKIGHKEHLQALLSTYSLVVFLDSAILYARLWGQLHATDPKLGSLFNSDSMYCSDRHCLANSSTVLWAKMYLALFLPKAV